MRRELYLDDVTGVWHARVRVKPRLSRDAFLFMGLVIGILQGAGLSPTIDSVIYWRAHLDALYPTAIWIDPTVGYVYAPPMAQMIAPLHLLGYGIFQAGWTAMLFGCLWYCAGIWSWPLFAVGTLAIVFPALPFEVNSVLAYAMNGNVQLLLAAAIVASFRHPGLWALPALTKPTMAVGILWFAFRREWRAFAFALATIAAVSAVSFLLAPNLWSEWLAFLVANQNNPGPIPQVPIPLAVRVAMSAALLVWAAPRNHRWAVPIAAGWAIPLLYVGAYVGIWVGAIRLAGWADRLPLTRSPDVAAAPMVA